MEKEKQGQMDGVRVRYAPSPTGYMHEGNLKIAVINALQAAQKNGKIFLRYEDTDRARSKKEYEEIIEEALKWTGIKVQKEIWRQSERMDSYKKYLETLIEEKKVYFCTCQVEDKEGEITKKKIRCGCEKKDLSSGVVRFRVPEEKILSLKDGVLDEIKINTNTLEDFALRRSDGTFTYNFAVVVDDIEMKITDVIRGNDHIYNTFKQILLYQAFNAPLPAFFHLPMVGNKGGEKLSKRKGSSSVLFYKEEGILGDAMFCYLAKLGGGYGDQEPKNREDHIKYFDIKKISKSQAVFDEDKLISLSGEMLKNNIRKYAPDVFVFIGKLTNCIPTSISTFLVVNSFLPEFSKRSRTLKELATSLLFVYLDIEIEDQYLSQLSVKTLTKVIDLLTPISDFDSNLNGDFFKISGDLWNEDYLHNLFRANFTDSKEMSDVCNQLRISLMNTTASPSIFFILGGIGKKDTLRKLHLALNKIK